jgi:maltooligosyltrehalose trehalohydrolase
LAWAELDQRRHRQLLDWHRHLIRLRRQLPALTDPTLVAEATFEAEVLHWRRGPIRLVANLSATAQDVVVDGEVVAAAPDVDVVGDRACLPVDSVVIWSTGG